jgi:hypothetical protein
MSAAITIPIEITPELQIGTVFDSNSGKETPVRLRDLMSMNGYNRNYRFIIKKEHPSITHVGISIHEAQCHGDGWTEIANTIGGDFIQTMMLDYFNKHVWKHFLAGGMSQRDKMKSFGYFTTDHIKKNLDSWGDNNLYFWSDATVRFQKEGKFR